MLSARPEPETVRISVVIPALNEERMIGQCLGSLASSDLPRSAYEVIVIDNGSEDRTIAVAESYQGVLNVTVMREPKVSVSALRNFGAAAARGEILAFLDADCVVGPNWLSHAVNTLSDGKAEIVGGGVAVAADSGWPSKVWYGVAYAPRSGLVSYVPSGNMLMRRSVFHQLGGFDEALRSSEDWDLCLRAHHAGFTVRAVAELAVTHTRTPRTLAEFYCRERWHGAHVARMLGRNRNHRGGARSVVFGAYSLLCAFASLIGTGFLIFTGHVALFVGALAMMLAGAFACSLRKLRGVRGRRFWRNLLPLTVLHAAYGLARGEALLNATHRSPQQNTSPEASRVALGLQDSL